MSKLIFSASLLALAVMSGCASASPAKKSTVAVGSDEASNIVAWDGTSSHRTQVFPEPSKGKLVFDSYGPKGWVPESYGDKPVYADRGFVVGFTERLFNLRRGLKVLANIKVTLIDGGKMSDLKRDVSDRYSSGSGCQIPDDGIIHDEFSSVGLESYYTLHCSEGRETVMVDIYRVVGGGIVLAEGWAFRTQEAELEDALVGLKDNLKTTRL